MVARSRIVAPVTATPSSRATEDKGDPTLRATMVGNDAARVVRTSTLVLDGQPHREAEDEQAEHRDQRQGVNHAAAP
jgi:hypothetical protein